MVRKIRDLLIGSSNHARSHVQFKQLSSSPAHAIQNVGAVSSNFGFFHQSNNFLIKSLLQVGFKNFSTRRRR